MLFIPILNIRVTNHQADCLVIILIFVLINIIFEINFKTSKTLHFDPKSKARRNHNLKNLNPFYYKKLSNDEKRRKIALVKKLKNYEENSRILVGRNTTIQDKISSRSNMCLCNGISKTKYYNSDFKLQDMSEEIKKIKYVKDKNFKNEFGFYHKKGKNEIIFTGGEGRQHKFWHYPGGGIRAEIGQWSNVKGLICTYPGEEEGQTTYKIDINVEGGYVDFLKEPTFSDTKSDDYSVIDYTYEQNKNIDKQNYYDDEHEALYDDEIRAKAGQSKSNFLWTIKKQNPATDNQIGYKNILIKSSNLEILNQQLLYLYYRFPDTDKIQIRRQMDEIVINLNEDNFGKSQEIKVPIFVENPMPPMLNINSDVNSRLDKIISVVLVGHHKNGVNIDEIYSTRYGKLPIILVLPDQSDQSEVERLKLTSKYKNIDIYSTDVFPHKLAISQVETEFLIYSDLKNFKNLLNSDIIQNGLKYINSFGVDIITANSDQNLGTKNTGISINEKQSFSGNCYSHYKLKPEFTDLQFNCRRTQYGNHEIYLGRSLEVRKVIMATKSNHGIEFFNVARKLGQRVIVGALEKVYREFFSNFFPILLHFTL